MMTNPGRHAQSMMLQSIRRLAHSTRPPTNSTTSTANSSRHVAGNTVRNGGANNKNQRKLEGRFALASMLGKSHIKKTTTSTSSTNKNTVPPMTFLGGMDSKMRQEDLLVAAQDPFALVTPHLHPATTRLFREIRNISYISPYFSNSFKITERYLRQVAETIRTQQYKYKSRAQMGQSKTWNLRDLALRYVPKGVEVTLKLAEMSFPILMEQVNTNEELRAVVTMMAIVQPESSQLWEHFDQMLSNHINENDLETALLGIYLLNNIPKGLMNTYTAASNSKNHKKNSLNWKSVKTLNRLIQKEQQRLRNLNDTRNVFESLLPDYNLDCFAPVGSMEVVDSPSLERLSLLLHFYSHQHNSNVGKNHSNDMTSSSSLDSHTQSAINDLGLYMLSLLQATQNPVKLLTLKKLWETAPLIPFPNSYLMYKRLYQTVHYSLISEPLVVARNEEAICSLMESMVKAKFKSSVVISALQSIVESRGVDFQIYGLRLFDALVQLDSTEFAQYIWQSLMNRWQGSDIAGAAANGQSGQQLLPAMSSLVSHADMQSSLSIRSPFSGALMNRVNRPTTAASTRATLMEALTHRLNQIPAPLDEVEFPERFQNLTKERCMQVAAHESAVISSILTDLNLGLSIFSLEDRRTSPIRIIAGFETMLLRRVRLLSEFVTAQNLKDMNGRDLQILSFSTACTLLQTYAVVPRAPPQILDMLDNFIEHGVKSTFVSVKDDKSTGASSIDCRRLVEVLWSAARLNYHPKYIGRVIDATLADPVSSTGGAVGSLPIEADNEENSMPIYKTRVALKSLSNHPTTFHLVGRYLWCLSVLGQLTFDRFQKATPQLYAFQFDKSNQSSSASAALVNQMYQVREELRLQYNLELQRLAEDPSYKLEVSVSRMNELLEGLDNFIKCRSDDDSVENIQSGHLPVPKSHTAITSSFTHLDVSKILQLNGVSHFNEHVLPNGYVVDVFIPILPSHLTTKDKSSSLRDCSKGIVIEFDGPLHFESYANRPIGPTVMKRRHLESLGYVVAPISYLNYVIDAPERKKNEVVLNAIRDAQRIA